MTSACKMIRKHQFIVVTAAIVLGLGLGNNTWAQQGTEMIYFEAPPPETLAEILFPPRYRGAAPEAENKDADNQFGMMINFHFDSTQITEDSQLMLASVGEMMGMESVNNQSIVIEGHTDAVGNDAYNQALSEARAKAIKQHLVQQFGIAPKRLKTVGKGERQLHLADKPAASINRRATFRPAKKLVLK